jgi:hypothetical protein
LDLREEDQEFVKKAAAGGLAEVKLSELATIKLLIRKLRLLPRKW